MFGPALRSLEELAGFLCQRPWPKAFALGVYEEAREAARLRIK